MRNICGAFKTNNGIVPQKSDSLLWGWSWASGFKSLPSGLQVQPRVRITDLRGRICLSKEGPRLLQFSPGIPQLPMPSRNRWDKFTAYITGPLKALSKNEPLPLGLRLVGPLKSASGAALPMRHLTHACGLAGIQGFGFVLFFNLLSPCH